MTRAAGIAKTWVEGQEWVSRVKGEMFFFLIYNYRIFLSIARSGNKRPRETRTRWRSSGLRDSRFLSKHAGRSSKQTDMSKRARILLPLTTLPRGDWWRIGTLVLAGGIYFFFPKLLSPRSPYFPFALVFTFDPRS